MGGEQVECLDFFAKEWNPIFFTERNLKEDTPWRERKDTSVEVIEPPIFSTERNLEVEVLEGGNGNLPGPGHAEVDDFESFLWDCEDSVPGCNIAEVENFVKGCASLADLRSGKGPAGERQEAWFDERSSAPLTGDLGMPDVEHEDQKVRVTTATGIYRRFQVQSRSNFDAQRANRKLMLFRGLDANFILALAETAMYHEISLLRDAIWKHIAFKMSIRVKLPEGFATFQMEIHIPSFELRMYPLGEGPPPEPVRNSPRQWTDLSFLEIGANTPEAMVYGFRETHFTMVICGLENRRWTGYSFVDSRDDDEDLEQQVAPYEGIHRDPISDGILDANMPIGDPREYFLVILKIRFGKCLKEWKSLIRPIECSIKQYKRCHTSTLSTESAHQAGEVKKTFDWTRQTMELLNHLHQELAKTIEAWETFSAPIGGDINYFSDFKKESRATKSSVRISFRSIRETVETLVMLKNGLKTLYEDCRGTSEALHLRLTLEANEAVRVNGVFANFTVSVISPVMVAIAYYSIPKEVTPLKIDAKYFLLALVSIIAIVQLLFIAFSTRPWSTKANAWRQWLRLDTTNIRIIWMRQRVQQGGSDHAAAAAV